MGIVFLVWGRLRERYVTPGWDEPADLKNASASEEIETLCHERAPEESGRA